MSLEIQINNDIKKAMLAKDKKALEALRAIKAGILLIKTGGDINSEEIPANVEVQLLQKLVKQRKESAEIYAKDRPEMAEEELFQASIIKKYLPEQMGTDELRSIIEGVIAQTGASSMKDMGKVMGMASKSLEGKADNKSISSIVKELLG